MYLYLLNNKADVLNDFNTYKEEEEKQYEDHKIRYRQLAKSIMVGTHKRKMISNINLLLPL
jgi:hypothetical protein